jgi:hypothetical protein
VEEGRGWRVGERVEVHTQALQVSREQTDGRDRGQRYTSKPCKHHESKSTGKTEGGGQTQRDTLGGGSSPPTPSLSSVFPPERHETSPHP